MQFNTRELITLYFIELKAISDAYFSNKDNATEISLTHIQDFTKEQVQYLVEIAESVGFSVNGTMNKHKAAFLISYNDDLKRGNYMVYDLG